MKFFTKLFSALRLNLVIPIVGVLVLSVFSSLILHQATQAQVVIIEDGKEQAIKTHSRTVEGLLEEVGIAVGEHDALSYDKDATIENGMKIDYQKSKTVYLRINNIDETFYTLANTVEEFLQSENLEFSELDEISHENSSEIEEGFHLLVKEAYPIIINDGGDKKEVWTTGASVEELLSTNEIVLNEADKIKPAVDQSVNQNTEIAIVRVVEEMDVTEEVIKFKTEKKEDSSLAKGKEKVVSEGEEGTLVKEFLVTLENGEEVNRDLVEEKVKAEAKNKVVAVGTKVAEQNLVTLSSKSSSNSSSSPKASSGSKSNSAPSTSGGKTFSMSATAYTAGCNGCSGITATGINLNANPNMKVVAVDPSVIPLGTRVWVEGYGNAIAGDTGGAIKGNRIDVHVPSKSAAYSFGRKRVQVKVLD